MAPPLLSSLREPPVVGRFYLVPVVRQYPYDGRIDDWPVIGPKHADAEIFNFPYPHFHVDARFLSHSQERFALRRRLGDYVRRIEAVVGAYPLHSRGHAFPKGRPELKRLRCNRSSYGYAFGSTEPVKQLRAFHGDPAQPIRRPDGRLLCPHRKVDLSQFPADDAGIVTCPLHGLRVQCGMPV